MRNIALLLVVLLSFLSLSACSNVPKMPTETDALTPYRDLFDDRSGTPDESGISVDYHVFSPVADDADDGEYPVVIWLHGMGQGCYERAPLYGSEVARFASEEYQSQFGDGAYIVVPRANENDGKVYFGFYTTNSWMADDDEDGVSDQLAALQNAIDDFLSDEEKNIDKNRIYIGGFSAGGYMTLKMLLAEPELYAAAFPICPAYLPTENELLTVADKPIWLIAGLKDPTVKYDETVAPLVELLEKTNTNENTRITILNWVYEADGVTDAESQHHSWIAVTNNMLYKDGSPYDERYPDGFIAWLATQDKDID